MKKELGQREMVNRIDINNLTKSLNELTVYNDESEEKQALSQESVVLSLMRFKPLIQALKTATIDMRDGYYATEWNAIDRLLRLMLKWDIQGDVLGFTLDDVKLIQDRMKLERVRHKLASYKKIISQSRNIERSAAGIMNGLSDITSILNSFCVKGAVPGGCNKIEIVQDIQSILTSLSDHPVTKENIQALLDSDLLDLLTRFGNLPISPLE
jgi:hypothetical protein